LTSQGREHFVQVESRGMDRWVEVASPMLAVVYDVANVRSVTRDEIGKRTFACGCRKAV
jgi:hypothetical protein